jgi:hypothetical protein
VRHGLGLNDFRDETRKPNHAPASPVENVGRVMGFDMTTDDKFLKAVLEAPVSVGRHVTQFQFVVADGIARRAPWLTTREIVRDTNAMMRVVFEYAIGHQRAPQRLSESRGDCVQN